MNMADAGHSTTGVEPEFALMAHAAAQNGQQEYLDFLEEVPRKMAWKADILMSRAISTGYVSAVQRMLNSDWTGLVDTSHALCCAAEYGNVPATELLVGKSRPEVYQRALRYAIRGGHERVAWLILHFCKPDMAIELLSEAVVNGCRMVSVRLIAQALMRNTPIPNDSIKGLVHRGWESELAQALRTVNGKQALENLGKEDLIQIVMMLR
jgi:hypothetical protein